uniref:THAP domain-containing protein 1 n=1 Tax=Neogobius melanostomus TaxID=47308 RepID=A0A8C6SS30_9GOBI
MLTFPNRRFNKVISFHCFPKDPELRAQWLMKIRRDFTVKHNSRVCSRHFETGQIFVSSSGKRCLQPKAVPSLFHWNHFTNTERPRVWELQTLCTKRNEYEGMVKPS